MQRDLNYLPNIEKKTGKTTEDFVALAIKKGLGGPAVKPHVRIAWLKEEFGLDTGMRCSWRTPSKMRFL